MKENEKLMKEYMKKRHELVERLVKATTVEECLQIGREFDEASDKMNNADRELYLTEATGNARLDRGIDEKIERLRNPEKYKAYILDPPPDIPADKVDLVERERLKQEYMGKLNDIVRRAKEARTIDECVELRRQKLEETIKLRQKDPELCRNLKTNTTKAHEQINEQEKIRAEQNLVGKTHE
jgi:hypothetical protein